MESLEQGERDLEIKGIMLRKSLNGNFNLPESYLSKSEKGGKKLSKKTMVFKQKK